MSVHITLFKIYEVNDMVSMKIWRFYFIMNTQYFLKKLGFALCKAE